MPNETIPPPVDYPYFCGAFMGVLESLSWDSVDNAIKRYVQLRDEKAAIQAARMAWHDSEFKRINGKEGK